MSEESDRVTVRRLPEGTVQSGLLKSLTGTSLQINLSPEVPNVELNMGSLVEVGCEQAFYLGEVQGRRDSLLIVAVEHAISRSSLSAIRDTWHGSRGA
jgi:hypothetical protein